MKQRSQFREALLSICVVLLVGAFGPGTLAQQDGAAPPDVPASMNGGGPSIKPDIDAGSMLLQQYTDPAGRFGFVAPATWGRLPSPTNDEVVFQNDSGDSIRVSVEPLKVDPKAFANAYVDTYLKVLAQTFTNVKFVGQRNVDINYRKATDYVFTAQYGQSAVTCHQVVLLGGDKVLYVTFAGFGALRAQSEQLFHTSLVSLWLHPTFAGITSATILDPNAPAYVIAIPEGWVDQSSLDGNSHTFRPPGSRPTSPYVGTRVTKLGPELPFSVVDDAFVAKYQEIIRGRYPTDGFEMRQARKIFLGGAQAVRFDYAYISNLGIRRSILLLCIQKGYLLAISCDAPDQSFPMFEQAYEHLVAGFKFK